MRRNGMMALALVGVLAFVACEDDDEDENRWEASLSGAAERPTPVTTNATGTFVLTDNGGSMTYTLTVNNLPQAATLAHIHIAPPPRPAADTSGGVVVNLNPAANVTNGILAQGTFTTGVTGVSLDSVRTLMENGRAYVNVHTAANPGGHIRGTVVRD